MKATNFLKLNQEINARSKNQMTHQYSLFDMFDVSDYEPECIQDPISELDLLIGEQLVTYYRECLSKSNERTDDLLDLGVSDLSVLSEFKIGYGDRSISRILPPARHPDGAQVRGSYQRLGLVLPSGQEYFRGQYTIPIYSIERVLAGLYGHYRRPSVTYSRATCVLFPGCDMGVCNPDSFLHDERQIICQSPLQAAILWSNGQRNAVSLAALVPSTVSFINMLKQSNVRYVQIKYENDEYGKYWCSELVTALKALNIKYSIL